jgi:hypothetical protein
MNSDDFMPTKYKSLLALFAATAAAANLSCASQPAQPRAASGPVPQSRYQAGAADDAQQAAHLADFVPAPMEKIGQTVFPIPDILCAASPTANKPTAEHLEDTIAAALNDVRKPGRAKANAPGGPVAKVHAEPGILVFSGTWEETELVRSTLQALKDTAQERQSMIREREQRARDEANRKEAEYSKPGLR